MKGEIRIRGLFAKSISFVLVTLTFSLVGMIAISGEENARLPMGGSAAVRDSHGIVDDQYLVQTSVSHQIHCLVSHAADRSYS